MRNRDESEAWSKETAQNSVSVQLMKDQNLPNLLPAWIGFDSFQGDKPILAEGAISVFFQLAKGTYPVEFY